MNKVEATKEKIIEATVKIAMAKGFANTRTVDISREAGVSEGLIYKYFPSKKHLFAEIISDNIRRLQKGIEEIIANRNLNPTAKMTALVGFHFDFFSVDTNLVQLVVGHSERKSMVDLESVFQHALTPYVKLIIQILEEGIAAGEFRSTNTELAATAIIGSMQVTLAYKVFSNRNINPIEMKKELVEYILNGIRTASGSDN